MKTRVLYPLALVLLAGAGCKKEEKQPCKTCVLVLERYDKSGTLLETVYTRDARYPSLTKLGDISRVCTEAGLAALKPGALTDDPIALAAGGKSRILYNCQ